VWRLASPQMDRRTRSHDEQRSLVRGMELRVDCVDTHGVYPLLRVRRRTRLLRSILTAAVPVIALVAVAGAGAATTGVSITPNGYVAKAATISAADAVQFTNSDAVAHQVVFKSTTGVTCAPNPLVLQPTQSGACTFASTGTFAYSDPNIKGKTFQGTITVTAPVETLTLSAAPLSLRYSAQVTLNGILSSQKVGENVDVLATECGQTATTKTITVQTTTGGAFTAALRPAKNTEYTVKSKSTTSKVAGVKVRPRLRLGRVAAHRYSVRVFAAQSFAGKYVSLQRFNGSLARWVFVKRVLLRANSTNVLPTVISSRVFRSTVRSGVKIRLILPQSQAGSCYVADSSNVIRS
jgi:plastocyanin